MKLQDAEQLIKTKLEHVTLYGMEYHTTVADNGIGIVLKGKTYVTFSRHICTFLLNFQGDKLQDAIDRNMYPYIGIFAHVIEKTNELFVFISHERNYDKKPAIDVAIDLLLLSIETSKLVGTLYTPIINGTIEDILTISQNKKMLLKYLKDLAVVSLLILPCDDMLYTYSLCCIKHKYLSVAKLSFIENLYYSYSKIEDNSYTTSRYVENIPNIATIEIDMHNLLYVKFSEKEWLDEKCKRQIITSKNKWEYPTKTCNIQDHHSNMCCIFHKSRDIASIIFDMWFHYYYKKYNIGAYYDKIYNIKVLFNSINSYGLFAKLSGIDISNITFPKYWEEIKNIRIEDFYKNERKNDKNSVF